MSLFSKINAKRSGYMQLEYLWGVGLGFAVLLMIRLLVDTGQESSEWTQYLGFGLLLPAALILAVLANKRLPVAQLKVPMVGFAILISLYYYAHPNNALLIAIPVIAQFVWLGIQTSRTGISHAWQQHLPILISGTVAWTLSYTFIWWVNPYDLATQSMQTIITTLLILLLCFLAFTENQGSVENYAPPRLIRIGKDAVAFLFFVFASYKVDMRMPTTIHHCGLYITPAEMLRQGGHLLWNVPSSYGFLSELVLASMPFQSAWQSLYVLNTIVLSVSAFILYKLIQTSFRGWAAYALAVLVSAGAVFLLPGWGLTDGFAGPQSFPSSGSMRYIWVFVMVAYLIYSYRHDGISRLRRHILIGSFINLCSFLWAVESGFFTFSIWSVYLLVIAYASFKLEPKHEPAVATSPNTMSGPFSPAINTMLFRLGLPVAMLLITMLLIDLLYLFRIGHLPDWRCYYEHSIAVKEGLGSMLIDPQGPIIGMLFCLLLIAVVATRFMSFKRTRELAIAAALFYGLFAVTSNYIGRSHPANLTSLIPLVLLFCAATMHLLKNNRAGFSSYRIALLPVFAVTMISVYDDTGGIDRFISGLKTGYVSNIEDIIPSNDQNMSGNYGTSSGSLDALINQAGIQATEPVACATDILFLQSRITGQDRKPIYWLPVHQMTLLNSLPHERIATYISRFIEQFPTGGWLIICKRDNHPFLEPWLSFAFQANASFENADWRIVHFVPKANFNDRLQEFNQAIPGFASNSAASNQAAPASDGPDQLIAIANAKPTKENFVNVGVWYSNHQKSVDAINYYRKAIAVDSLYSLAYNNLGYEFGVLMILDDYIHYCQKALDLQSDFDLAKNNVASAKRLKKEEAKLYAERGDAELLQKSVDLYLVGNYNGTIKLSQVLLARDPKNTIALNNMGIAYNALGDFDAAISALKKAVELNPNFELAKNNLADSEAKKKNAVK